MFWITRGIRPRYAVVLAGVAAAEQFCLGDPTPRWLLAQFTANQAVVTDEMRSLDGSAPSVTGWRREPSPDCVCAVSAFPGRVGQRGRRLSAVVHSFERFGSAAFQVPRGAAKRSISTARPAVNRSIDAANDALLNGLPSLSPDPTSSAARATTGQPDAIGEEQARPDWWVIGLPTFRPDFLSGAYATEELPDLVLMDAAMNRIGGAVK